MSRSVICGIYKITSPTGRIYIGQSVDIYRRWLSYFSPKKCKAQVRLYNSLMKYGVENHKFEIIELCDKSELNSREIFWIKELKTFSLEYPDTGLNLTLGGKGVKGISGKFHSNYGIPLSQDRRDQLIELNKLRFGINNPLSKKIYQYDFEGSYIGNWINSRYIQESLGFAMSTIANCCLGNIKSCYGFRWFYEFKGNNIEPYEICYNKTEKVFIYNSIGEFLRECKSLSEAARVVNMCRNTLLRMLKSPIELDPYFLFKDYRGQHLSSTNKYKNKIKHLIIDLETGIYYNSIREAAIANSINTETLAGRIRKNTEKRFLKT